MILLDFSQIAIFSVLRDKEARYNLDEHKTREIILHALKRYNTKFKENYGDLIICCDARGKNWRKEIFPQYKAARAKNRENSDIDWAAIFNFISKIKEELHTYMPYKIIEISGMEGDDVIATLCQHYNEDTMIVSSDEDYIQLQKNKKIKQFSLKRKDFLTCDDIDYFKFEHIVKGDTSDGVPNILSDSNCFIEGVRQTTITKKKVALWYENGIPDDKQTQHNWKRNELLIDLTKTPQVLVKQCKEEFEDFEVNNRKQIYKYFKEKKLGMLMENIQEFY